MGLVGQFQLADSDLNIPNAYADIKTIWLARTPVGWTGYVEIALHTSKQASIAGKAPFITFTVSLDDKLTNLTAILTNLHASVLNAIRQDPRLANMKPEVTQ